MDNEITKSPQADSSLSKRPNILMIMVDQQRYPVIYENAVLREWSGRYLQAEAFLKANGFDFKNHYAGSTACSPSRATLYTGQYPSLHGVTQTDGAAKGSYDPDMFWLNPSTVPTLGDYFRAAGYRTYWKGKWHASAADILVPGTHTPFLSYDPDNGAPNPENEQLYLHSDILGVYGFRGWIGPEPHGASPRNSGSSAATGVSGRDVIYRQETVDLIRSLDRESTASNGCRPKPWFIMCSFVNPHDIAIFGVFTRLSPQFDFKIDPSVPYIPPAPTASESLAEKPVAQISYRNIYPYALQPLRDTLFYRRLYYSLQLEVDRQICGVLEALRESSFYQDTIVIFTADHGELLGAHGGLFQKWYQAYEESIHVPLIIHNPVLFEQPESTAILTSHVDILPTILGMSGLNVGNLQQILRQNHTEVRPLVGRDLSPLLRGKRAFPGSGEPIYFMTDDNVTKGLNQVSVLGIPYHAVVQPNSIETVIANLSTGKDGAAEKWKYSRYFENLQFQSIPGRREQFAYKGPVTKMFNPGCCCDGDTDREPAPDQYELYNLSVDPLETANLVHHTSPALRKIRATLDGILAEQRRRKRLYPASGEVPGKPSGSEV